MSLPDPVAAPPPSRPPAPELIGAIVAAVIVAIVATTAIAATPSSRGTSPPGGSPGPSLVVRSAAPTTRPPVDPQVVDLLRSLNEQLAASGAALQAERERGTFRTPEVANLIRQVNARVAVGAQAVTALDGALGEDEVGGRMAALYDSIEQTATQTLDASINNENEYKVGAGVLVQLIGELPALQAELDALLEAPPSASPSVAPSGSGAPTTPPSTAPTVAPTSSPSPTPSGSPVPGDERIVNGGFEEGVGSPWGVFLGAGASATLSPDSEAPGAGATSARVEIATGSAAYSGISLRQGGLELEAGRLYTLSVAIRSAAERDVRIRVASRYGAAYMTRLESVGKTWSTVTITFTALAADPDAVLELDLGRADPTTWFDAVSFRPLGG